MDKTLIGRSNVIIDNNKQATIINDVDYERLRDPVYLKEKDLIDERKNKKEKDLTMIFEPGILTTVDTDHSKGYPPSSSNFPPYPSESGAPSVLPSGTWRSQF